MKVTVEFWYLVGLLLGFLGVVFTFGKLLLGEIEKRLDQRFETIDKANKDSSTHWDERFSALLEQNRREAEGWKTIEKDFLRFQAELPLQYVRRDDYVRNQTVIEAKIDSIALKIENVQLKGLQQ
ncbi:hypothetical protein [Paludibacterium denitrificans]|uniref:Uncharacterized protein n=1 Tax=Paludibacterium denitrificans TaxID=2675226 RepID=A0A844G893_9NEIS|nr:hypothetical protein [Paludibacterium denitrificans]MTD32533.1 hypothetical protein [Paludibacterium denitrificans]